MSIVVTVHLEQTEDEPRTFVWWGESDDVPGFSVAADHLPDLISRAQEALAEVIGSEDIEFRVTDFARSPGSGSDLDPASAEPASNRPVHQFSRLLAARA